MKLIQKFLPLIFVLGISTMVKSCTPKEDDGNPVEPSSELKFTTKTEKMTVKVDTLHTSFQNPWGMTWLGDGRMLVTERKGEILIFKDDKFIGQKVQGLPAVYANGQAGLLDITVHPDHAQNGWIYISYAKPIPGGGATAVARFKLNGNTVSGFEDLIVTTPASNTMGAELSLTIRNFCISPMESEEVRIMRRTLAIHMVKFTVFTMMEEFRRIIRL
jgi:aldose sugar dehydrogenase